MKHLLSFLLLATLALPLSAQAIHAPTDRPKVAVVLAGGGAKGVAHIAALKTIEEAGLPIDLVVGTSMGSIIGGMYCVGYSPDSMKTICSSNDWVQLIIDNPDFGDNSLTAKKDNEKYLLRMAIDQERRTSSTGRGGVIAGRNVMRFFRGLTRGIPDSIQFADLPVPFACVGTNADDGRMKVFTEGNLPLCIRASMSIPTVFTPTKIHDEVYIDGGVVNNFPVDVARSLGADIVIGVDLITPGATSPTNSAVDILLHCIDMVSQERYRQNIAACDIYIPIDVTGYSAASFSAEAIDTLITRGMRDSQLKAPALDSLFQSLHLPVAPIRTRIGEYSFAQVVEPDRPHHTSTMATIRRNYRNGAINLGGRFDNDEYASLLLGLRINLNHDNSTVLNVKGRLGERIGFTADLRSRIFGSQNVGFRYSFMHRELDYFYRGDKSAHITSNYQNLELYFNQVWHAIQYRFGVRYQMHHFRDVLFSRPIEGMLDLNTERYWSYFIEGEYNSLDQQYFPNSGQQVIMKANVISDNLYKYQGHTLFPIFQLYYQGVISANDRLTFLPHIQARSILPGEATCPWSLGNIVGGLSPAMIVNHQLTMAGVAKMNYLTENHVAIFGLTARHRIFKTHYLSLQTDCATLGDQLEDLLGLDGLTWGLQAAYSIKTPVGPVSLDMHWSNHTDRFDISFNAGYYF